MMAESYFVGDSIIHQKPVFMRSLLLPAFLLSAGAVTAQPTLTAATSNPVVGTSVTYYSIAPQPAGNGGANVTWDFSGVGAGTPGTGNYVACNAATNCSNFPGSNLVAQAGGGSAYYIADNTRLAINGTVTPAGTVVYANPEDWTRYPVTYNTNYTDNFTASVTSTATVNRSGTITVTADGWGTLKLPNRTYNNVLRVKHEEAYSDMLNGVPIGSYTSTIYTWHSPSYKEYLLSKTTLLANGQTLADAMTYTSQTGVGIAALSELEGSLQVGPNPVRGILHLRFETTANTELRITLTDLLGRPVADLGRQSYPQGSQHATLSTEGLARGLYLVRLQSEDQTIVRKVEVL